MKFIKVFHNPGAGEGEHSKEKLIEHIREAGFDCSYSSTEKPIDEKRIPDKTDIIVLAGGDGTVRMMATYLLKKKILDKKFPIGLLPCGTANNIAATLGITGSTEEIIARWKAENIHEFDIGKIAGIKEHEFFLEALGFGVFPRLMKEMKNRKTKSDDPEQELHTALHTLLDIIEDYKPRFCKIKIDDVEYSGNFLMVEIMNIRSIGPNLNISTTGKPDDGMLDVILISASQRENLADYVRNRLKNGKKTRFFYPSLKAKKIKVEWGGKLLHADDELVTVGKFKKIKIEVVQNVLNFFV